MYVEKRIDNSLNNVTDPKIDGHSMLEVFFIRVELNQGILEF